LAGLYHIGAMVAMIDAINGPETLDKHIESVRQVALADHILITKLDLIDGAKVAEEMLTARLRRLNPAAKILRIDDPVFDAATLLRAADPADPKADVRTWLNAAAYEEHDGHHHDHAHDDLDDHDHHHGFHDRDIASFCFVRENPIPRQALQLLLDALQQNLGPNLLRVKGIVHVAEEPHRPAVIQGAQHLLHNL